MKKVVLISALLGAFTVNVFATNTPSNVNQTHIKTHHSKTKTHKKQKIKHQLNNAQP